MNCEECEKPMEKRVTEHYVLYRCVKCEDIDDDCSHDYGPSGQCKNCGWHRSF